MSNSEKIKKKKKKALRSLYQRIQREAENVINQCLASSSKIKYAQQAAPREIMIRLLDEYNINLKFVEEATECNFLFKIQPSNDTWDMFGQLYRLVTECEKIVHILEEEKTDKGITQKFINQLKSLKDDIEKENIIDYAIKKNLEKSIDLFERGEIICSALFSSRVISYTIDQFTIDKKLIEENDAKKKKENFINLIIKDCINKGLIAKDNKNYINNLLQFIKLARNKLTHNVLFFPEAAECLGILSNSIELIKLKNKFDDYLSRKD
ncbi:MAG: hypothetical protein ACFFCE_04375 [Promethearchaeota archaeon]